MEIKRKHIWLGVLIIFFALVFTGCFPGTSAHTQTNTAGFFSGIWHGWIAPISLIIGLFNKNVHIYEAMNNGWWYDFGFYIAIISGFGGLSFSRRKRKNKKD